MLMRSSSLLLLLAFAPGLLLAQTQADTTIAMEGELETVVVTATKNAKVLRNVPVPMSVVTRDAIKRQGAMRLSDLLAEQPGLQLIDDHGQGIQVQGFASDYTLILIDGEPLIGRVAGTLDLDRITIAGVERVEVVRGPSSSLYGSEALAGVINIITRTPEEALSVETASRYETHNTLNFTMEAETAKEWGGIRVFANRYSSSGYDLFPDVIGSTVPDFTDYTIGSRIQIDASERLAFDLSARVGQENQQSLVGILVDDQREPFNNEATRNDWNVAPSFTYHFAPQVKLTGKLYGSRYATDTQVRDETTQALFSRTQFEQFFGKAEAQLDAVIGTKHLVTGGAGYILESVAADRITGGDRTSTSAFVYAQHEWLPNTWLDLITSARFDYHSDYTSRLSPKLAVLIKPSSRLRVRASVGSGFKAPTFQQRYLDFTNAQAGYSVFGSVDVASALRDLEAQGQVRSFLRDVATLETIEPEASVSVNVGVEVDPTSFLTAQVNVFRNNVSDLIEAAPVAIKTNGQSAFTYFNLSRIVTQGVEAELTVRPATPFSVGLSYQFLDTFDRDVVDQLEAGTVFKRVNGRDIRLSRSDYGGLMNRSKHTGTLRFNYDHPTWGLRASVRGVYRSKYGFGDVNGNLILDDDSEYVSGYAVWHATATQRILDKVSVQVGVQNLLDETNPTYIPSLSGRLFFTSLHVDL